MKRQEMYNWGKEKNERDGENNSRWLHSLPTNAPPQIDEH